MSHTRDNGIGLIDPIAFRLLDWRAQNDALEPHLRWVLRNLVRPATTVHVAWALSERTGLPEKSLTRILLDRFAPHYEGLATHDGEQYRAYGKLMRKWRWHPQKAEAETCTPSA